MACPLYGRSEPPLACGTAAKDDRFPTRMKSRDEIRLFGDGPICRRVREVCVRRRHEVVDQRPYDLIVLANVTRILKGPEIAEAGLGVLCFHPSVLPRHRGGDASTGPSKW